MGIEFEGRPTDTHGRFSVAGVAHRGTDVDEAALWSSLNDYEDDLRDVGASDDYFGVFYDMDESSGEFTYVAGREVDSTDDVPPEMTVVEIPEATYAVLSSSVEDVDDLVTEINEEHLGEADDDRVAGPVFERYEANEDPADPTAPVEFYVPVDEG